MADISERKYIESIILNYFDSIRNKIDNQVDNLLEKPKNEYELNKERIMLYREKLMKIVHKTLQSIDLDEINLPKNLRDEELIRSLIFKEKFLIYLESPYEDDTYGTLVLMNQYIPIKTLETINEFLCNLKNSGKFLIDKLDRDKLRAFYILKQFDPLINNRPSRANRQDIWLTTDLTIISNVKDFEICDILDLSNTQITSIEKETFKGFQNLHTLNLSDNYLTALDNDEFKWLDNLKILNLQINNISFLQINLFIHSSKLQLLNLHENKLVLIEKDIFSNLENLSDLDLSNNSIQSIHKDAFNSLLNLKELNLRKNEIDFIDKDWFKNLNNLQILNLSHNYLISRLESNNFANLINLKNLILAKISFDSISNDCFNGLINLEDLVLIESSLENKLNRHMFKKLKNLKLLSLDNNKITSLEGILNDLVNLEVLSVSCNHIDFFAEEFFENFHKLKLLNLSFNRLKKCELKWFLQTPNLERLYLNNNEIESLEEETFQNLLNLKFLDISANKLKSVKAKVFNGLLNVQIIYDEYLNLDTIIKDYKDRKIDLKPDISIRLIEE